MVIDFFSVTKNQEDDDLQLLPEFRQVREFVRRTEHNLERRFDRLVFDSKPILRHDDPFIDRILGRINEASLTQYRFFEGRAERLKYEGDLLEKQKTVSSAVFLLRNETDGVSLKFRVYERNYGLLVHILFIERDADLQGNFFTIKRNVVEEMWSTILEPAGAAVLMNFLPFGVIEDAEHNKVALISENVADKIRQMNPKGWDEAQKFTSEKQKEWNKVVNQRESLLSVEELERRKKFLRGAFETKF